MIKKFLILIFIAIFLSSCITPGGTKNNLPEEDNSGIGLKFTFDLDDNDLAFGNLNYKLSLINTGKETITLTRDNFKLKTIEKTVEGNIIIDQDSLEEFYNQLFANGELKIYRSTNGNGFSTSGVLKLNKEYIEDQTKEKVTILLETDYDYGTEFSEQVELTLSNSGDDEFDELRTPEQASPVQMKKIELKKKGIDNYWIRYTILDKGPNDIGFTSSLNRIVKLDNLDFVFSTRHLSNCEYKYDKGSTELSMNENNLVINEEINKIYVECPIDTSWIEKETSTLIETSGSFEYNYKLKYQKSFKLPDNINSNNFY